ARHSVSEVGGDQIALVPQVNQQEEAAHEREDGTRREQPVEEGGEKERDRDDLWHVRNISPFIGVVQLGVV
ncbi:hypothetical protein PENTCL1PPCAC_4532, partial [Pristionchus entomophagus]